MSYKKLGCSRDVTLIYCRRDRSVHRCQKGIDLRFGDRSFEPAFHPFHIYIFSDGKTPHLRKAFISILHENPADQFSQHISANTIQKYMEESTKSVEKAILPKLSEKFAIMIDGISTYLTHNLAIFAVFPENYEDQEILLACSPLWDEEKFDADAHIDFIQATLEIYGGSMENVGFIIANNEPKNKAISDKIGVPNLEMVLFLKINERFCDAHTIQTLVTKVGDQF